MKIINWIISRLKKKNIQNGASHFFNRHYQMHNVKRLSHLDTLGLDIRSKSVLEIGAGIGDHTYYYLIKSCSVVSTDARENLVNYIKKRFAVDTFVLDVEKNLHRITELKKFDIIRCYGLLYHIQNPEQFIAALKHKGSLLLLETCVSHDFREYGPHFVKENKANQTQSVSGNGCRPTRKWVYDRLKENFNYVYMPVTQPDHVEFPTDWSNPIEDRNKLIRAVFIASEKPLTNPMLSDIIPVRYK